MDEDMLPPKSDEEFAVPSTSSGFQSYISNQSFDNVLQEMLLASPSRLFSAGLLSQDCLQATWEQWLCLLASSLTPDQWQAYWMAHTSIFGAQALPVNMLSFFNPLPATDPGCRHAPYGEWGSDELV